MRAEEAPKSGEGRVGNTGDCLATGGRSLPYRRPGRGLAWGGNWGHGIARGNGRKTAPCRLQLMGPSCK